MVSSWCQVAVPGAIVEFKTRWVGKHLGCKEILVGWWLWNPATTGGPEVTSRMRLQPPWANKPTGMDGKDSKLHANHLTRYGRMHWDIELMTYWLEKTETTKRHVQKPQECHHPKPPWIPLQTLWECCGSTWMCLLQYDLIARVWLLCGSQKLFLQMMWNVLVDYCLFSSF